MKEGYKQTVIGEIPEEWVVKTWQDICEICYGKDQKDVVVSNGQYPIYGTGGLMATANEYLYDKPSVLIGRKGTIDKPFYLEHPFWTVDTLFYSKISKGVHPRWFFYIVDSTPLKKYNEATGVPSLSRSNLYSIKIAVPPLPEQQKITEILSTVDEKIEVIDEQIAQTQELKKGLMQRLLTKGIGHTKFKASPLGEIPESWVVKSLEKLVNNKRPIRYGIVQTGENVADGIPCLRVADFSLRRFSVDSMIRTSKEVSFKHPSTILQEGDIVFPLRGRIGDVKLIDDNLAGINLTRGIALISNSDKLLSEYLLWQLQSPAVIREIMLKVNGTTLQEIPINGLKSVCIPIAPKVEQEQISKVLSTVDEKLDILQDKKEQYKVLKKGLMQQLLTGKLRVNHLIEQNEMA